MHFPKVPPTSDKSNLDFALHAGRLLGGWWDCSLTGDRNHSNCEGDRAISVAVLKLGPVFLLGFFGVTKMCLN